MATFAPNIDWKTRTSGTLPLGERQYAVICSKCGSPYVATLTPDEPPPRLEATTVRIEDVRLCSDKHGKAKAFDREILGAIPGLVCEAGDCGFRGDARIA